MDPNLHETPGLGLPQPSLQQAEPAVPAPSGVGQNQGSAPQGSVQASSDGNSDDLDQEWINKAKAIVEKTKNDPFAESRELSKIKADYLKTRYNKHIKVSEDQA